MANQKFSQMPVATLPLIGTELICLAQSGVSVAIAFQDFIDQIIDNNINYGNGVTFDENTNTLSADINTTNLQFTATQINTIQNIDITASPTFETMTLNSTTEGFLMPRMTTVNFDSIPLPENGLVAWSQSSNRFRVNSGFPGAPDYKELAYFDDLPIDSTSYGEIFFQGNTIETAIPAPGVFVKIDAVYNPGDLLNFTNGSGLLTYIGAETKHFSLNLSLTTTLNLATSNISVVLYKNGVAISKSEQTSFTGSTTPGLQNGSVNALVSLSTNDYIEIYIANVDSSDNILVHDLNLNVCSIGGSVGNLQDQVVVAWDNSTNPVSVVAGTDIDISGGVISYIGTSGDNVVVSWDGSTNPVNVVAGTDIDITNGVISYTGGGGGGSGPSGNYQLFEMTEASPGNLYNYQFYYSIINAGLGDNTVNPNQLNIGEQVILEFTFELDPVNVTTVPAVSGSFRWTFGPYFYEMGEMILANTSTPRSGTFKYTVTRINQTQVTIDVNGYFVDGTGALKPLLGNPGLVPNTFAYNENNSYLMAVEYILIQGTAQEYLNVIPLNLTIEQHTSRTGAGGSGIITSWDGSTSPVAVTASTNMSITNGVIATTAEPNVVTSVQGSTTPVGLSSGTGIAISPSGVISATGTVAATENSSFFTGLLPSDNYVSGVWTPVWFTSSGLNQINANTWLIGDTFEINVVGEFVTRQQVADTTTGSFFRLTVGTNQILSNDLDVPLINDGQVRVKPFNFKIMFTRIDDIVQPTWIVSGNGFFTDLSDNFKPIVFQANTLYNIDVTINNIINLEFQQNHTVQNTYDFQCVQLNMRKYTS